MGANARGLGIICAEGSGAEAAWAGGRDILAPASLLALINHFKGTQVLSAPAPAAIDSTTNGPDLRDIRGQHAARRALEVAASGGHNLLMLGPPGAGKSMLAACLPGILPPLDAREMLEVSMIQSVAGKLTSGALTRARPFRDPHHSSSLAAMVGGGRRAAPGEISLAHRGVLFLDELPEFPRAILESLRQPLESGTVTVARANAHVTYPANLQLIAAMNPCRCGYVSDPGRACGKAPSCARDYQSRLSGPLLDRIDIHIDVPEVETLHMLSSEPGEDSATVARRVADARERQKRRFAEAGLTLSTNADLQGEALTRFAAPNSGGQSLLEEATGKLRLSMRGYTRVLRVARTIADLAGSAKVERPHVAEALSYRHWQLSRLEQAA
jgi:magnesium chelatase family protein